MEFEQTDDELARNGGAEGKFDPELLDSYISLRRLYAKIYRNLIEQGYKPISAEVHNRIMSRIW